MDAVASAVRGSGGRVREVSNDGGIPVLRVIASPNSLEVLARVPSVILISQEEHHEAHLRTPPDHVITHEIDTSFNAHGSYGTGVRVGVIEPGRLIDPFHEAFSALSGLVEEPGTFSVPCTVPADCGPYFPGGIYCGASQCVSEHARWVSSMIASTKDGDRWNAAEVELYFPTQGHSANPGEIVCDALGTDAAYNWLSGNDVHIVNESWGCDALMDYTLEGQVQDWYARFKDVTITKAGGYSSNPSAYSACEFTANSICVSVVDDSNTLPSNLNYDNPTGSDREEPDVVARGDGEVASAFSATAYANYSTGASSFSAPAVAALAALLSRSCDDKGNPMEDHRVMHAVIRNSALHNVAGWRYSTPGTLGGGDMLDGAGRILASAAELFCTDEPDPSGIPGGRERSTGILVPGSGTDAPNGDDLTQNFQGPNEDGWNALGLPTGNKPEYHLMCERELKKGDRVRYTYVYDACPAMAGGGGAAPGATAPAAVSMDIDVALYHDPTGTWEFASQSFDDNVEGFDVIVQEDGLYQIYATHEMGVSACAGAAGEPYGWAVNWWSAL